MKRELTNHLSAPISRFYIYRRRLYAKPLHGQITRFTQRRKMAQGRRGSTHWGIGFQKNESSPVVHERIQPHTNGPKNAQDPPEPLNERVSRKTQPHRRYKILRGNNSLKTVIGLQELQAFLGSYKHHGTRTLDHVIQA